MDARLPASMFVVVGCWIHCLALSPFVIYLVEHFSVLLLLFLYC